MKVKLDSFERQIENDAASFRPVSKKKLRKLEAAIDRARKSRNINIRISETDLGQLKKRSQAEGVSYQTLISSILHRYVTSRLADDDTSRKSLRLLRSGKNR